MPSENIEDLLKADFDSLTTQLEHDKFAERLLYKLKTAHRRRIAIVGGVGAFGAATAATQLTPVAQSIAAVLAPATQSAEASQSFGVVIAALIMAGAMIATALVIQQET